MKILSEKALTEIEKEDIIRQDCSAKRSVDKSPRVFSGSWLDSGKVNRRFAKRSLFLHKIVRDQKFFQEFATVVIKKLPYISMGMDDFEEWKENLRTLLCEECSVVSDSDIDGMDREIRRL